MNRNHVAPLAVLAWLALLAGCQGAAPADTFPQAVADGWLGSFNSGDVEGLGLMYSSDAEILPPDEPVIAGPEAIQAFWQAYGPGQVRIQLGKTEAWKIGELWFREGAYQAQFQNEGEPRVGKFIELWKRENGNWLMYRQMWNRNEPLVPKQPSGDAASDESA
jgi:ketosteroid isomerase-like protein